MDIAKFRQVMDAIDANPNRLDQASWMKAWKTEYCNTVMCVAGYTIVQFGYVPVWEYDGDSQTDYCVPVTGGMMVRIDETAEHILELDRSESIVLFHGDNPNDPRFLRKLGEAVAARPHDEAPEDVLDRVVDEWLSAPVEETT